MSPLWYGCPAYRHLWNGVRSTAVSSHHSTPPLGSSSRPPRHLWTGRQTAAVSPSHQAALPAVWRRTLHTERWGNASSEERLRRKDSIPPTYRLVYLAPMEWYIRLAYVAFVAPPVVLTAIYTSSAVLSLSIQLTAGLPQVVTYCVFYSLLAAGALTVVRRYAFRIYHSRTDRNFCAVFTGVLGLNSRHVHLPEGSVHPLLVRSDVSPWKHSLFRSPHGKLILLQHCFRSAEAYNLLTGNVSESEHRDGDEPA